MNPLESNVIRLKSELEDRQKNNAKKVILSLSLQQFLKTWFDFIIPDKISKNDKIKIKEIQELFEKNEIAVYSRSNQGIESIDKLELFDQISVRLAYTKSSFEGKVPVGKGTTKKAPYQPYQVDAIQALTKKIPSAGEYAGILAIPTGGGKTYTAAYWLLKNVIDQDQKLLWLAHRHELLNQAMETFRNNSFRSDGDGNPLLQKRDGFSFRLISGIHDRPRNISKSDDIIFASKDSLNSGVTRIDKKVIVDEHSGLNYLYTNWLNHNSGTKDLFIVIDEAHHTVAKTYRNIIDFLKGKKIKLKILGLTATPFRTADSELGLLKRIYKDDIAYSIGISKLIEWGFLSRPNFIEPIKTGFDMAEVLDDKDFEKVKQFDLESIGEKSAKKIAEHKVRNKVIVDHYCKHKTKYGQTILFALNVDNAIALDALFKKEKIESDYVISGGVNRGTLANSSAKDNIEKIEKFRQGKIKVLINYNILTEGLDIPKVKSVFLTRPTISTILMTQMIGRGLRGERVGGTKITHIVSFIDDWHDRVAWADPKELIDSAGDFIDKKIEAQKRFLQIISVAKLQEYALMLDSSVDNRWLKEQLEHLNFIDRLPVGLYSISVETEVKSFDGKKTPVERKAHILVYSHLFESYTKFVDNLPAIFEKYGMKHKFTKEYVGDLRFDHLADYATNEFFDPSNISFGFTKADLTDIIRYFDTTGEKPLFVKFDDREKYDIKKLAQELYDKGIGGEKFSTYLQNAWDSDKIGWKALFGMENLKFFVNEVTLAWKKLMFPEMYTIPSTQPEIEFGKREYKKMTMDEINKVDPDYGEFLKDAVFKKFTDKDGFYFSAESDFRSRNKLLFHIDHIQPMKKGGLTELSNLQLLHRKENWKKGSK